MGDVRQICYRAFELIRQQQFDAAQQLLSNSLAKTQDALEVGLLHSACGVLEKTRGQGKAALKHYQRAEKLIADDPALKLITARLLIDEFNEYDAAIKRCDKAIALLPENPVIVHHARTLQGLAQGKRGRKREAIALLESSIVENFRGFATVQNIDFHLLKLCVKRRWGLEVCRRFLHDALAFARQVKEDTWIRTIEQIVAALPAEG